MKQQRFSKQDASEKKIECVLYSSVAWQPNLTRKAETELPQFCSSTVER
jgi:hypothetical protein